MKLVPDRDDSILPAVFKAYGWNPRQIRYIRGVLRVDTGDEIYALKKTSAKPDHLCFLDKIFSQLNEAGYHYLLPWVKTDSNEVFVEEDESCWYAQPWYGKAMEKGDEVSPDELIRGLARFHKLCEPVIADEAEADLPSVTVGLDRKKEYAQQLMQWREAAMNREFASPFEKAFLSHFDYIDKAISFTIRGLEKYGQKNRGRPPRYTLVHNRLHPHNVLVGDQGWRWIDFDHATAGSPVTDIAMFLRRFIPFDGDEVLDPFYLLDEYQSENPLMGEEKRLLALHLAYPEGLIRTIHSYDQQQEARTESVSVQKLEEEIERLHLFQEWVRTVWKSGKNAEGKKRPSHEMAQVHTSYKKH
ncbi:phosphotransferase [Melghirimyces algeriensis]|uniref:Spore coat protein YsxE n=1 Tax=Melghirimyces algeriensis TaxID=910412 RepID=A0A521AR13_9BACL|nr:phosphotransferase [Melghirimyces algeriensis]SMO37258.1 spore coat protein YsxE [Melghirimyces algeriensis]